MYLCASLTMMGLLASVDSLMDSQGGPLNEHLSAARPVADVWSNTTMDAFCGSMLEIP